MVENEKRERWCVVLMTANWNDTGRIKITQIGEFDSHRLAVEAAEQLKTMYEIFSSFKTTILRMSEP
jgi:hypothetical protein